MRIINGMRLVLACKTILNFLVSKDLIKEESKLWSL